MKPATFRPSASVTPQVLTSVSMTFRTISELTHGQVSKVPASYVGRPGITYPQEIG